jgi:hypothetical protein
MRYSVPARQKPWLDRVVSPTFRPKMVARKLCQVAPIRVRSQDAELSSRMAYLGCVFTQHNRDEKGHSVRDYQSSTYVSGLVPIDEFGPCLRQ